MRACHGRLVLPDEISTHKINEVEQYNDGNRGLIRIRFRFTTGQNGLPIVELFANDDYSSWYQTIEVSGRITNLEGYRGQFGRAIYPDDPERTQREWEENQAHNVRLHAELVAKGLEKNDQDPEFENQHVIRHKRCC